MSDDRQNVIRERAYQLWEDEGRPEGRGESHWHQASRDIEEAHDEAASITEPSVTAKEAAANEPADEPRAAKPKGAPEAVSKASKPRKAKAAK